MLFINFLHNFIISILLQHLHKNTLLFYIILLSFIIFYIFVYHLSRFTQYFKINDKHWNVVILLLLCIFT